MRQGGEIVGGRSSSFTHSFEYPFSNHTRLEYKQPSHGDRKVAEQGTIKELFYLEFGSRASLYLRKLFETLAV